MIRDLRAYLDTLHWEEGDPAPVLPLDLFFEGNDEEESIAPNQWGDGRPPIAALYRHFKAIAARPEVSEVLVGLHFDWNHPMFADGFPPAETIFIYTSAPQPEVESWLSGLHSDGAMQGWPYGTPKNAPEPAEGQRVYWVSWD